MAEASAAALALAAACCAAASLLLGALVARRPPGALDRAGFALRGRGVEVAYLFTLIGRWPALTVLGIVAFGVAITLDVPRRAVVLLLAVQVVSQIVNSLLKLAFARLRPDEFVGKREREASYPSGHSVTAVVFFGGFAILASRAPFPVAIGSALVAVLVVCLLAIPWSRLALGAHYVTDVAGGVLLGAAWLCALLALLARTAPATMSG